ncbi:DUF1642 domain-containing protein [Streptococcus suis]
MNKDEAIKQVNKLGKYKLFIDEPISKSSVLSIIYQIDTHPKVVVPKYVDEIIKDLKAEGCKLLDVQSYTFEDKVQEWIDDHYEQFCIAFIFSYEVEKERLYVVTDGNKLYLKEFDELNAIIVINDVVGAVDYAKRYADKAEAQKAADELGWVVKEVE